MNIEEIIERMHKANSLEEIDQAVQFNIPILPDHPFFTNFGGLRGDFEDRIIYRSLNVIQKGGGFTFDYKVNSFNKEILFLGGMRGSGKTTELAKYAKNLHSKDCFFVVTCNLDNELDMDNMEYMDILIFQLEKLTSSLLSKGIKIDDDALKSLNAWFSDRITEINTNIKGEVKLEAGYDVAGGFLKKLVGLIGSLKAGISGTKERANIIRTTLKNNFPVFALKFNEYIEEANTALRRANAGKEVLFVIDGIEKTLSTEISRKLILEESNRIRQIKAYTIFTLPIHLMRERGRLNQFAKVESFPFVRLVDRRGASVKEAITRFKEFIYNRIDKKLFESEELVEKVIELSGGSPRELLRILETTAFYADFDKGILDSQAFLKAINRLSNQASGYLTEKHLRKLKELKQKNEEGVEIPYDDVLQDLLENIIVMEYNDGNYKRVNPLIEFSKIYNEYVLGSALEDETKKE